MFQKTSLWINFLQSWLTWFVASFGSDQFVMFILQLCMFASVYSQHSVFLCDFLCSIPLGILCRLNNGVTLIGNDFTILYAGMLKYNSLDGLPSSLLCSNGRKYHTCTHTHRSTHMHVQMHINYLHM